MEGELGPSSAPLADLCSLLGISTSQLAEVEERHVLHHTFSVQPGDAARLDPSQVRAFVEHYGDLAKIEIATDELPELLIQPGVIDADVAAFAASASSGGPYQAIITVNKSGLAQRLAGAAPTRMVCVFLFAETLRLALAKGISRFEAEVWPDAPAPLVIAVLDSDINLAGSYLSVLGRSSLSEVQAAASAPSTGLDFNAINEVRDRLVGWDTQWVRALTPWHFDLTGTSEDAELLQLLLAQLVKLAVLFTCDRARVRPGSRAEIIAEYRGGAHIAVMPIDERVSIDCTPADAAAVMRAVDWCYQRRGGNGQPDWVSDRLPFLQTRVAQSLEPHAAEKRLVAFVQAMPYLLEGIEWQWKAFIEGKVGDYLDRVQQVEAIVTDTVSAFADRTSALAKALTDTILAAVAVLIGSFIAAAFATPFNGTLFRIGVLAYAAYVLLFPGATGLLASVSNFRAARTEFDVRISRFKETLFPEKVTEIVGTRVADAQRSFYRWLSFVAAAYVAVVIAATVAAATIPGVVGRDLGRKPKAASPITMTMGAHIKGEPAGISAVYIASVLASGAKGLDERRADRPRSPVTAARGEFGRTPLESHAAKRRH